MRARTDTRPVAGETDERLIDLVRGGDHAAYGELYRRHHRAARSTARFLGRGSVDADDVVADAFAGVLSAIRNGRGPRDEFGPYLLACVRNGCRTRRRDVPFAPADTRLQPSGTIGVSAALEDPERYIEADTVARAFAGLAPRWQQMLWSTAVEQRSPQELGKSMSLTPNAVAQLAHRAREAFATAYLSEHVGLATGAGCDRVVGQLAAYVRDQLPAAKAHAVEGHLAQCADCSQAVADLRDVNASLRSLLPASLGTLTTAGTATEVAVGGAGLAGIGAGTGFGGTGVGGAGTGLSLAGLAAKGVAGLMLLAPVLVSGTSQPTALAESPAAIAARPVEPDPPAVPIDPTVVALPWPAPAPHDPVDLAAHATSPTSTMPPTPTTTPVAPEPVRDPVLVDLAVDDVTELAGVALAIVGGTVAAVGDELVGLVNEATALASALGQQVGVTIDQIEMIVEQIQPLLGAAEAGTSIASAAAALTVLLDAVVAAVPAVNLPGVTLPGVTLPTATEPEAAEPEVAVNLPEVSVPAVSVTVPAVSVPSVSVPPVTLPAVTVPAVSLPVVTVPAVTLPGVTLPAVTVTVPALPLLGG